MTFKRPKPFSTLLYLCLMLGFVGVAIILMKPNVSPLPKDDPKLIDPISSKYTQYHQAAKAFSQQHQLNPNYYILIDFSLHSGKNRLFVYDFRQQTITDQALVTHGSCDVFQANPTAYQTAKFSNQINSHCSSLGKYKIGKRDSSGWGIKIKYWLHGLESSNDNAIKRIVVLHSWEAVADQEIYPYYSPLSFGCPAVSNQFLQQLDLKFKHDKIPALLWIIS